MARLMVYDRTCRGQDRRLPLSYAWQAGQGLYGGLGWIDAAQGVASWAEALDWLATALPEQPIEEVQFWGHGRWGRALIGREALTAAALRPRSSLHGQLEAVRARMVGPRRWWFRTCETLGAVPGQQFAQRWSDFFGGEVAGHTYVIGVWQSGLHCLRPGMVPDWSATEGLREGTPEQPRRALGSAPWCPRTISFLQPRIPATW